MWEQFVHFILFSCQKLLYVCVRVYLCGVLAQVSQLVIQRKQAQRTADGMDGEKSKVKEEDEEEEEERIFQFQPVQWALCNLIRACFIIQHDETSYGCKFNLHFLQQIRTWHTLLGTGQSPGYTQTALK